MIISELCSNGDLFDYLRASSVPAVRRMVSHQTETLHDTVLTGRTGVYDARHRPWDPIPPQSQAIGHPQRLQVVQHSHHQQRCRQDHRLRTRKGQAIHPIDGSKFGRDGQLASTRIMAPAAEIQFQGRRLFVRDGVLGDVPVAFARSQISMGGEYSWSNFSLLYSLLITNHELPGYERACNL